MTRFRRPGARLALIDPAVADAERLVRGADPGMRVVRGAPAGPGRVGGPDPIEPDPIEKALAAAGAVSELHLVTHGRPGTVRVYGIDLGGPALARRARRWRRHLAPGASILVYGCESGRGAAGRDLVRALARATGARVAASSTPTGAAARGGDWRLDVTSDGGPPARGAFRAAEGGWTGLLSASFSVDRSNPFGISVAAEFPEYAKPVLADIDGDGDLDAFVGNRHGNTVFFENTGSTTNARFASARTNPFGLGDVGHYAAPFFADIDGDGDLDAFVGNSHGNTVFFENTGSAASAAFASAETNPFGLDGVCYEATPTLVDIDGDGDLDLFVGDYCGDVVYFENTGTSASAAFGTAEYDAFGLESVGFFAAPTFADIDGDGDLDALVGNVYGEVVLFENTGSAASAAFAGGVTNPAGLGDVGMFAAPALGDLDGDGSLDALVGEWFGNVVYFENTGTSGDAAFVAPPSNPFGLASPGPFSSPDLVDIDGDGDLDAFVGNVHGNTVFYENVGTSGSAVFSAGATNPDGLEDVGSFAAPNLVDIDGDGDLDAFVGNRRGNLVFFENVGSATSVRFTTPTTNPFGLTDAGSYAKPDFVDIDGDGDLDAFVGDDYGNIAFFENIGTATSASFAEVQIDPFGLTDAGFAAAPRLVDIDRDGDLDAFVGVADGNFVFFENTGSAAHAAFGSARTNPFSLTDVDLYATPDLVDIDGDGDLDLFSGSYAGNIVFFLNEDTQSGGGGSDLVVTHATASDGAWTTTIVNNGTSAGSADIVSDPSSGATIRASVPAAMQLTASGTATATSASSAAVGFIAALQALNPSGVSAMSTASQSFFDATSTSLYLYQRVSPDGSSRVAGDPFIFSGSASASGKAAIIVDTSGLSAGNTVQVDDIAIVAFSGPGKLTGGAGSNRITASDDVQILSAGAAQDTVYAGGGDDIVFGNQDADLLFGNTGSDRIFGGQDADTIYGGQADDIVIGNLAGDRLFGNLADDLVHGGQGDDLVHGGRGNDTVVGGLGADTVLGGLGDDSLSGAAGADTFVFIEDGGGTDTILDFTIGEDTVAVASGLNGLGLTGADDLVARLSSDASGNAVLDLGDGQTLTFSGVAAGSLSATDFQIL